MTIGRLLEIEVSATSVAVAANRCSNLGPNLAPNLATSPAAAILANAIVPTKEHTSRIGARVNGELQMRDRRIVRRTPDLRTVRRALDRRTVRAEHTTHLPVAVEYIAAEAAAYAPMVAAGAAASGAAAVAAVAAGVVAVVAAAAGARTSDSSMTSFLSAI